MSVPSVVTRILAAGTLISASALGQTSAANSGTPIGRSIPGRFIVTYRNGAIPPAPRTAGAKLVARQERLGVAILQTTPELAAGIRGQLAADPTIESIVEDRVVTAHTLSVLAGSPQPPAGPDSLYNGSQGWAVRAVGGFGSTANPGPWSVTTGADIRIAILDSGVDARHPDIAPNLALNLSEVDQSTLTGLPSPCDDGSPQDQEGHGTWVASLAAGAFGGNTGMVAGVAPGATLLNIKVLERVPAATNPSDPTGCVAGQAAGLLSWVIQGIEDAVANRADIVSLSLGTLVDITTGDGAGLKATFDHVTHAAATAGVIVIAAAGNDGFDLGNQRFVELPAQARDVLAVVAATNPACAENLASGATCVPGPVTLPYYSNYGAPMNAVAAPGGSYPSSTGAQSGWIWGACGTGLPSTQDGLPADPYHSFGCFNLGHAPYVQAMGTSAAAPLVAGAAALLRAAHPTWTAGAVIEALRQSATYVPALPVPEVSVAALLTPAHAAPSAPPPAQPVTAAPAPPAQSAAPLTPDTHHINAANKR